MITYSRVVRKFALLFSLGWISLTCWYRWSREEQPANKALTITNKVATKERAVVNTAIVDTMTTSPVGTPTPSETMRGRRTLQITAAGIDKTTILHHCHPFLGNGYIRRKLELLLVMPSICLLVQKISVQIGHKPS